MTQMERKYTEQLQKMETSMERRFGQLGLLKHSVTAAIDRAKWKHMDI